MSFLAETMAYLIGVVLGKFIVGLLCGLIVYNLSKKKRQLNIGRVGLGCCVAGGVAFGLGAAIPLMLIFLVAIYLQK